MNNILCSIFRLFYGVNILLTLLLSGHEAMAGDWLAHEPIEFGDAFDGGDPRKRSTHIQGLAHIECAAQLEAAAESVDPGSNYVSRGSARTSIEFLKRGAKYVLDISLSAKINLGLQSLWVDIPYGPWGHEYSNLSPSTNRKLLRLAVGKNIGIATEGVLNSPVSAAVYLFDLNGDRIAFSDSADHPFHPLRKVATASVEGKFDLTEVVVPGNEGVSLQEALNTTIHWMRGNENDEHFGSGEMSVEFSANGKVVLKRPGLRRMKLENVLLRGRFWERFLNGYFQRGRGIITPDGSYFLAFSLQADYPARFTIHDLSNGELLVDIDRKIGIDGSALGNWVHGSVEDSLGAISSDLTTVITSSPQLINCERTSFQGIKVYRLATP